MDKKSIDILRKRIKIFILPFKLLSIDKSYFITNYRVCITIHGDEINYNNWINISPIMYQDFSALDQNNIKYNKDKINCIINQVLMSYDSNYLSISNSDLYCILDDMHDMLLLNNNSKYFHSINCFSRCVLLTFNKNNILIATYAMINRSFPSRGNYHVIFDIFDNINDAAECVSFIRSNFMCKFIEDIRDFHKICPWIKHISGSTNPDILRLEEG